MNRTYRNFFVIAGIIAVLFVILLLLPGPEPGTDAAVGETGADSTEAASTGGPARAVAVTGVRLFDGERVTDHATVVFADGRVAAAGADVAPPEDARVVDGNGRTLLPGLIDAHVHAFGPALRDAARFGVTTVLDMFRPPLDFDRTRARRADRSPSDRADLFSAGYLATAAGGHGTQFGIEVPTLGGPDEAEPWVQARLEEGSDWIKIVLEDGSMYGGDIPTLDAGTVRALVAAAHERDMPAVAHVSTRAHAELAVAAGVDGLVHLFGDRLVDEALRSAMVAADVFVVPTLTVMAAAYGRPGTDWLLGPSGFGDRLGGMQKQTLNASFPGSDDRSAHWQTTADNLARLHAAGVPLLAGSDAPNPGTAHGASLHHELLLLTRNGLSPLEALRAATSVPAAAFGLDGRGCLQPGCIADALLVDGNPLRDITATTRIVGVWKNGHRLALESAAAKGDKAEPVADAGRLDLLAQRGRWMASSDEFMGGASRSEIAWGDQGLRVTGALEAGFPFPYAGTMWSPTDVPMQPADHGQHDTLVLHVEAASGELRAMLFSGEHAGAPPVTVAIQPGERTSIDLSVLAGLDRNRLRGAGVFVVGSAAPVEFTIREAVLE
jgi:imidazolonepropionase-like amidohydrolase